MMSHLVSPRNPEPPARCRRRAFTLVELLVVIGIIAVLIGVLLPALNAARKQAATVKCLSALREIGVAFNLYANFYRDAFPVVRGDTPDDGTSGPPNGTGPQNVVNRYYTDMIVPFLAKNGKMNFQIGTDRLAFDETRKSVLWGCPEWEGYRQGAHLGGTSTYVNGISVFESGYAMNMWPTYAARFPVSGSAKPPTSQTQMRWAGTFIGKYYKRSQWTRPSERLLMADATLWLLGFGPTVGQIQPQQPGRVLQDLTGQNNIDRYRHGKYPNITSIGYARQGGKVAFNVLYVDGHASTLHDIKEGYKAIRMRYPGP